MNGSNTKATTSENRVIIQVTSSETRVIQVTAVETEECMLQVKLQ